MIWKLSIASKALLWIDVVVFKSIRIKEILIFFLTDLKGERRKGYYWGGKGGK